MKTAILVILAILCTWFITSNLSIEMPLVPEVTVTIPPEIRLFTPDAGEDKAKEIVPPKENIFEELPYFQDKRHIFAQTIFLYVNAARADEGVHRLIWSEELHMKALVHCNYIVSSGEFEHSSENVFENLFLGPIDILPSEIVSTWMKSPGHRANILESRVSSCGVGAIETEGIIFVTYMAY